MKLRADLHIHSKYSFDSRSSIEGILKRARKNNLDIIAITDHEEFVGAELAAKLSKKIIVVKGEEIDTEYGDIIGLFLKKKIKTKKFSEVIKEIRAQGGVVVVPHPAMNHVLPHKVMKNVDLIEVFNSRVGPAANRMAKKLSKEFCIHGVAGSDSHFLFEIGNGITIIDSKTKNLRDIKRSLLDGRVKLECRRSPRVKRIISKIVKVWRRR